MQRSALSTSRASLMAVVALAFSAMQPAAVQAAAANTFLGMPKPRKAGRRYPEQSSRQAMRAHRRAQGGPGIVLVDGVYQPREVA